MIELEIIYYTGYWTNQERAEVQAAVETAGFRVAQQPDDSEFTTAPGQKGLELVVPPQLIIDATEILRLAAEVTIVAAPLAAALLYIYERFRGRKAYGSLQARTPRRIYLIPFGHGDAGAEAIRAITADLADHDEKRKGDMTWRDGRWQTVGELHGRRPRLRPSTPGHKAGHKREAATRVRPGPKGRSGQTR